MPEELRPISPQSLIDLVGAIFTKCGVPAEHAQVVADSLVEADLRGVRSHGVMRVPVYVRGLLDGSINSRPSLGRVVDTGPIVVIDADGGLGPVGAKEATEEAIARCRQFGVGIAGVRNSRHCGAMAYWAILVQKQGFIGFATTNAGMNMAPWGGKERLVGNNPFAMAVPMNYPWPFVLDMATSVAAGGKLDIAAIRGEPIPDGWAIDSEGKPTNDPVLARKGTLLPVGGAKGYGMALMLDVLAGVITGARFAANLGPSGSGHFFLALDPDRFMTRSELDERMSALVEQIKRSERLPGVGRIYLPGEIEDEKAQKSLAEGLLIEASILDELKSISEN